MADSISPYDLDEGDEVVFVWSPYGWAREHKGYSGEVNAEVTHMSSFCKHGGMCDIELKSDDGDKFVHHADNGYVSGDASGVPSEDQPGTVGMPDWTDVGRFRRYEER